MIAIPATIDLGRIEQGKTYSARFELRNQSQEVLRVSQIKPSCSCTSHELSAPEIQPSGSSKLDLRYASGASVGDVSSLASVLYFTKDSKQFRLMDCVVTGYVEPNIKVEPDTLRFQTGTPSRVDLVLSCHKVNQFTVTNAVSSSEAITITVGESTPRKTRIRVDFDHKKWSPNMTISEVTISVDDPFVPTLSIPITISQKTSQEGAGS